MGMFIATLGNFFGIRKAGRSAPTMGRPHRAVHGSSQCLDRAPVVRKPAPRKPLRIVHSAAGRIVISGRMADVCAELDRLAALEAQGLMAPARQGLMAPARQGLMAPAR